MVELSHNEDVDYISTLRIESYPFSYERKNKENEKYKGPKIKLAADYRIYLLQIDRYKIDEGSHESEEYINKSPPDYAHFECYRKQGEDQCKG